MRATITALTTIITCSSLGMLVLPLISSVEDALSRLP
jgi:hypothetical protein